MDDNNAVAELKSKLWHAIGILRREHIIPEDFHLILFLLLLQRDGFIGELISKHAKRPEIYSVDFNTIFKDTIRDEKGWKKNVFEIFEPIISRIDYIEFAELLALLNSLDQSVLKENFPEIFDDLLYKLTNLQGRNRGEYIQPLELSRFVSQLVDLSDNTKVYNPFAGFASFGIFIKQGSIYFGQEINQKIWAIGNLRILAYSRNDKSNLSLGDSIRNWNPSGEKFDLIIANPPFGMRFPGGLSDPSGIIKTIEHYFIQKGIEDLNSDGKLIGVIPHGFLFRIGQEEEVRKILVENDLIDMIISFPGGILVNTSVPVAVILINKNKMAKGIIRFVDAKKYVESSSKREKKINEVELTSLIKSNSESESVRFVSNQTVREFGYNLDAHRYFAPKMQVDDGIKKVKLGDVAEILRGQRIPGIRKGKFIRIRDLSEDKIQYFLDLKNVNTTEAPRTAFKITESCLLLATRWKSLKPTFFNFDKEPIYIIPDTIALKVDENKIDVGYLINELYSDFITETTNLYRVGDIIPYIRKEDLLNIPIPLPSLEEQRAKVQGIKETLLKEKEKELELFKKIHGLESDITEQNAHLRHSLAGPSLNLKGSFSNLKTIIIEKVQPVVPEIYDLKVSEEHELTFGQYLNIISRDIEKISDAVSKRLKVDTDIGSKKFEKVEIVNFIQNYINEYSEKRVLNFEIKFDIDDETFLDSNGVIVKTYILGNTDLLTILFDNLINNAVCHAFQSGLKNRIDILLVRNLEVGKVNEIYIQFSNTGNPFPEDFKYEDFIRKGSKAGANAGDGYGGWYTHEIINKLNGSFEIIDETGPEGLSDTDLATSFVITLPLIYDGDDEKI